VLFFFEVGFFVLALAALALAEWWGRGPALALWAVVTVGSWIARPLVRRRLERQPAADGTETRWRQAVAVNWGRFNLLLLLGLSSLTAWWWLSTLVLRPAP
jgi:hypothetical protein